jgi:hypothetical protein
MQGIYGTGQIFKDYLRDSILNLAGCGKTGLAEQFCIRYLFFRVCRGLERTYLVRGGSWFGLDRAFVSA